MEAVKTRTRRDEYAQATRRSLIDTGRRLFLERGYDGVSAEEIVRAAGLTRGALYHHFDGKRGLFEAVFVEEEERAARLIRAASAAGPETGAVAANPASGVPAAADGDLWARVMAGLEAFLDVCAEPVYRQIVLLNGPIALGWDRWRELDRLHLGVLLVEGVRTLVDAGLLKPHPVDMTAAALYGALTELSLVTAGRAGSQAPGQATREDTTRLVHTLLDALRA